MSEAADKKAYQDYLDYQEYQKYMVSQRAPKEDQGPGFLKTVEAGARGVGSGALLGHAPEVSALVGGLLPDPGKDVNEKLRAQGFNIVEPEDTYSSRYKQAVASEKAIQKESPTAFGAGQIVGTLASSAPVGGLAGAALKPIGLGAKTGGLLYKGAQAAGTGAIAGLLQRPEAELGAEPSLDLEKRLQQAKTGAIVGPLAYYGTVGLGKAGEALGRLGKKTKDFSQTRGAAALGMNKGQAKKLLQMDPTGLEGNKIKEVGDFALKNNLVAPGDEIADVAKKTAALKENIGEQIGQLYDDAAQALSDPKKYMRLSPEQKQLVQASNFNPMQMGKDFLDDISTQLKGTSGGRQAKKAIMAEVENFMDLGNKNVGIKDIQAFKEGLDDVIFASDRTPGNLPQNSKALKKFRDFLKAKIDQRIDVVGKISGRDIGTKLKDLNKQYSLASTAHKITKDRLSGELGNNLLSITDKMLLGGGALTGAASAYEQGPEEMLKRAALGAGAGLASKGARTYGRPLLAKGAEKLAPILERNLEPVGRAAQGLLKASPQTTGAAGSLLLNRK